MVPLELVVIEWPLACNIFGYITRIYLFLISIFSRKQHQYHSQRQPRTENQLRPVSNFYEYESIQAALHGRGRTNVHQEQISNPPSYQDVSSGSSRQQHLYGRNATSRSHNQHRGPFVTHVTIGENPQQNGTKV